MSESTPSKIDKREFHAAHLAYRELAMSFATSNIDVHAMLTLAALIVHCDADDRQLSIAQVLADVEGMATEMTARIAEARRGTKR